MVFKSLTADIMFVILIVASTIIARAKQLEDEDTNRLYQNPLKTIQSEDGDIIDCVDIYKQPSFTNIALRNHKIQMQPTSHSSIESIYLRGGYPKNTSDETKTIWQMWQRSGSCPKGTIPIRRRKTLNKESHRWNSSQVHERKKPSYSKFKTDNKIRPNYLLQTNRSVAILITAGYNYNGAKGDIKVWNPYVELDDEWSNSHIALENGAYYNYESVQSGWMVNPSLYGDRRTRFFVYWTADGSKKTGCFDLLCPGFVQTSNEVALGAAIHPISTLNGLPYQISLYIFKDLITSNFWVQYEGRTNIGYWPAELFTRLKYTVSTVRWGGEVYSSRVGVSPHTATQMGSGSYPFDWLHDTSGSVKRIRIRDNSLVLKLPEWVTPYADEYDCYETYYASEYIEDPIFLYGGPGRGFMCP